MYYVRNNHEPIITREIFNRTQEELARRNSKKPASTKNILTAQGKYTKYALSEIMCCGECGTKYRRVTWSKKDTRKVVWRCVSRLDYGTRYCKNSPTLADEDIKAAVVRAIRKFGTDDAESFDILMRATIADAMGLGGGSEEVNLLRRKIDTLNSKMMLTVDRSIISGSEMDDYEDEFREISSEIEQLSCRIKVIQDLMKSGSEKSEKLEIIKQIIEKRKNSPGRYDDSVVRQMIECIKVFPEGRIQVIFGGGYTVEERVGV